MTERKIERLIQSADEATVWKAYMEEEKMEETTGYKDFYYEVRNERGVLQATFARRYEAEKYVEAHHGCTVTEK